MTNEEKLKQIFSFVLELPDDYDVSKLRRVNTAGWDSLAHVSIIAAIESEFNITLDPQDYERLTSYEAALLLIEEK